MPGLLRASLVVDNGRLRSPPAGGDFKCYLSLVMRLLGPAYTEFARNLSRGSDQCAVRLWN